jgi:dihydroorotate dehydrogenase electron transfer subunit
MYQETATVLWNKPVGGDCFDLGLACPPGYGEAVPGQFVMVRLLAGGAPLLRRPFSIHNLIKEKGEFVGIRLLYKVVGSCTRMLSAVKPGQTLDLLGPLGRGFDLYRKASRSFIVAGGIGVAPLVFLAKTLVEAGRADTIDTVFIGGRSREDLLCRQDFEKLGLQVQVTTDDGSDGDQCLITDPMQALFEKKPPDMIYACGPTAMLRCVIDAAKAHGIACQISIETMMACGMGACLGCAVESKAESDAYLHACLNGPVFDGQAISL